MTAYRSRERLADRLGMDRLTVVAREDRIAEFDGVAVAPS
jgi:hypothetical protein